LKTEKRAKGQENHQLLTTNVAQNILLVGKHEENSFASAMPLYFFDTFRPSVSRCPLLPPLNNTVLLVV